jgi:hypothetical protein
LILSRICRVTDNIKKNRYSKIRNNNSLLKTVIVSKGNELNKLNNVKSIKNYRKQWKRDQNI